jgi:hypothetical protein
MKKRVETDGDELRTDYAPAALKNGVRGKYLARYQAGTNLVLLAPDVAEVFEDDEAVNEALRLLIKVANKQPQRQVRSKRS